MMSGRSFLKLLSKMRKISLAQRLNSSQSDRGAPSNSQMMGMGYGLQMSRAKSLLPDSVTLFNRSFITSRMKGRKASALRGEKAGATKRRRRTWVSPSADSMDSRRRARNSGVMSGFNSTMRPTALCQRLSRNMATTSSYLRMV